MVAEQGADGGRRETGREEEERERKGDFLFLFLFI